jgi:hypothetical protein
MADDLKNQIAEMQVELDRLGEAQWQDKLDQITALTIENAKLKVEVRRLNRIIEDLESR